MENKISQPKKFMPGVFSFCIVCYRNWEFMTETIDSVLAQDYDKIQLIVSDDGSEHFPIAEFEEYIESHKGNNLVSYVVRHSEQNEGTVRHLNRVLECVEGEYVMLMAADDTLDHNSVFSKLTQSFHVQGEQCGVVMGQTAMYDVTMTKFLDYFVWPDVIDAINQEDGSKALRDALYFLPCIPTTSTCFRRWVIDEYTPFDTNYKLIEDYPFHIKLAENNVKMYYENFVVARHRDGGISHGAVTALSKSKRMYYEDCMHAREEVLEKVKVANAPDELVAFNEYQVMYHDKLLSATGNTLKDFLHYAIKYPQYAIMDVSAYSRKPRTIKWAILVVSFLILHLLSPEFASVISAVLPMIPGEMLSVILSPLFLMMSGLFGIGLIMELCLLLVAKLAKFPDELSE